MSVLGRAMKGFLLETKGAAAAEIALWLTILSVPALSGVDLAVYAMKMMTVESAAVQAAEAARQACGSSAVPITSSSSCNQTTLSNALNAGAQTTVLNTAVTVASGYPQEQYYCVNSSGALVGVGTAGTSGSPPTPPSPNTCTSVVSGSTAAAGDYLKVQVTYNYSPIFSGISLAAALPTPITATAWLRLQ